MILKTDKHLAIQVMIIALAFFLLYSQTIVKLVADWSNDPNFSHGFLIPFVAVYMLLHKKDGLLKLEKRPSNIGLLVLIMGMIFHIVGNIGAELFVMRFSMVVTLFGIVLYLFGNQITVFVAVPLIYLIIMIPIPAILWNKIAFPLKLFASDLSSGMISLIGIPVFREGNILHLANITLEVVDACSGLRSLTSLLALGGAFAYLAPLGGMNKWILFISAVPIAVLVNVVRLTITAVMATYIGPETAHGFLHEVSGIIIFTLAIGLILMVFMIQLKFEKNANIL